MSSCTGGRTRSRSRCSNRPDWKRLEAQLASDYRRVAVVDDGRVELFERLGTDAAQDGEARRAASAFCQGIAGN